MSPGAAEALGYTGRQAMPFCPLEQLALKVVGLNSHALVASRAGTATPRGMKQSPLVTAMVFRGR